MGAAAGQVWVGEENYTQNFGRRYWDTAAPKSLFRTRLWESMAKLAWRRDALCLKTRRPAIGGQPADGRIALH